MNPSPARVALAVVGGITIVGLLLRLPSAGDSLYGDELSTYFTVTGHGLRSTIDIVRSDQELTPPLFYALSWLATKLGNPTETVRLVSVIAGVAAIPVTYLVGIRTVGVRGGVVGAALVALSPFLIFYSTEARAYALMMLLGLLSTLALLMALDDGRVRWWVAYAICSCAAVYTHYTVVFLLAAQLLWALWTQPRARLALIGANVAVAVALLPWLSEFRADQRSPCGKIIGELQPFDVTALRVDVGRWSIGHPVLQIAAIPGAVALALMIAGLVAGAIGAALTRPARPGSRVVLVVMLALALPVGAALASIVGHSIFTPRNLIASWPELALVAGALVGAGSGALRVVASVLLLGGFAVAGAEMLARRHQRPDYAAAVGFVERSARPGDVVVDQPFPTPGPLSAVDAAFARRGGSHPPVLRLGFPSLATELRARRPGGVGPCASAFLPPAPGRRVAREAAGVARDGRIYLIGFGLTSLSAPRGTPLGAFVGGLPKRFRLVQTRAFPGFGRSTLRVYVLAEAAATRGPVR
jgi:mannosyltransferase